MPNKNTSISDEGSRQGSPTNRSQNDEYQPPKRTTAQRVDPNALHCLDDVCILVRVPSSTTYLSKYSNIDNTMKDSDDTLRAYAKQAEERAAKHKESSVTSSSAESFNSVDYVEDHYYYNEGNDDQEGSSGINNSNVLPAEDCFEFMDTITFAKELVKNIVSESEANVEAMTPSAESAPPDTKEINEDDMTDCMQTFRDSSDFAYIDTKRSFTSWPTIEAFTIETGAYKIDEYLSSFETEEDWMYVIYYQGTEETPWSVLYKYQVTYVYETFGHTNKPGVLDFQEKWLHYILDSKIKFFKTVTY